MPATGPSGCDADNAGLTLPQGFCAGVWARGVTSVRRMAVAPNGDVFAIANAGGGGRGRGGAPPPPRGVFRLRDANNDGKADTAVVVAGGTGAGLQIAHGALYAEGGGTLILRYPFRPGTFELSGAVDTIVSGLPTGGHRTRDFVIRGNDLFVNVGSQGNVCPGGRGAPPADPCPELLQRAGIWKFSATQVGQAYSQANRYASGVRNGTAMALNPNDNQLYVGQHGRDQLRQWNNNSEDYNAENPGEEFFRIVEGGEYGWPYCYYSHEVMAKVLAPEYGGDGRQQARCAQMQQPVYAFPGHWAPNDALFYTGTQFPGEYRQGVFVAFHGSWNRSPLPQAGFNVTFLPMQNGRAAGAHRVFAGNFSERLTEATATSPRGHRPAGLAQLNDGSLLVSDDAMSTIFRIVYIGR
jgi:glucose/arabinose dehydrogenase